MKTISIINLKGGVAKTLTADSMAHVLATLHKKRVLLVDNDKQGNTSKAFGVHSYDDKSISDVLTARRLDPREVIKKTRFQNIDVMPANMTLIRANMEVLMDSTRPQQTRLRSALNAIAEENFYDFCIIDNAPDINISTIAGDMWDGIAYKTLGDEAYTDRLMKLNPQYRRTFVFPAGITLTIPEPETRVSSDLPPWKRGTAE